MLKFWINFIKSLRFMNRLADETGVDRKLYKAALTEVNANFALYMAMYDAAKSDSRLDADPVKFLSRHLAGSALKGGLILLRRFPEQASIDEFLSSLKAYIKQSDEDSSTKEMISEDDGPTESTLSSHFIIQQLLLSNKSSTDLAKLLNDDELALGYVFGFADMASYQRAGRIPQDQSLAFIHTFLGQLLEDDDRAEQLLRRAISMHSFPLFMRGRDTGASDFGDWVKTRGAKIPMGLAQHLR